MKKYKQLFIGVLIGALATATITFADEIQTYIAEKAGFPITVDGRVVEFDAPVVTINERAYLPLRAMGEVLGIKVDWNDKKQQVEILSKDGESVSDTQPINKHIPSDEDLSKEEFRGQYFLQDKDGVYYITAKFLDKKITIEEKYDTQYIYYSAEDIEKQTTEKVFFTMVFTKTGCPKIVVDFPKEIMGGAVIPYDYYVDEILPQIR
ncbi:MAG: hypothetical protein BWY15_01609 [Firmicutes bacterium ADurb.Bin193]|nr:MAG: hypothetical protein BWY15_01609 [Firmicutes bacterium ADurb.Bin193]